MDNFELHYLTERQHKAMINRIDIEAVGITWMAVHFVLCLGLRHPQYTGPSRSVVLGFVRKLGRTLVEAGVLTEEELAWIERVEQSESPHGGA